MPGVRWQSCSSPADLRYPRCSTDRFVHRGTAVVGVDRERFSTMRSAVALAGGAGTVFARLLPSSSSSSSRRKNWKCVSVRCAVAAFRKPSVHSPFLWRRDDHNWHCGRWHSQLYDYEKMEFFRCVSSGITLQQQQRRRRLCCSGHGEESLAEGDGDWDWDGLERWKRGGGVVHRLAQVDASVVVEFGAVVHANAVIGADTRISSGCVVGPHVTIGSHSKIGYNVALQNCSMGNACILHSGVCIGQDGFGFTVDKSGDVVKKPQMLNVRIGNNVEIGANSCIDRGSWRDTTIGDHTKIDNLVQIGHNVIIGRCCMLCGEVGLAGSCTLGDYVVMGGQSGVADHVSITSKVRIGAKGGVTSDIVEPGDYVGFPAVPAREWRRSVAAIRRLGKQPQLARCTFTEGISGGKLSTELNEAAFLGGDRQCT